MSRFDEMMKELCPNGVEYKALGEIGYFYSGLTGKTKDDFKDGNAKFVTYMNVFSNPALSLAIDDRVRIEDGERQNNIYYGDVIFTGSSETPDECGMSSVVTTHPTENLYLNSFCFGFRLYEPEMFCPDFLKHLFRACEMRKQISKTASGVTRFNVSKARFAKILIPVPPLPIQQEIVRILDSFTTLEAELEAELEARRKQYCFCRDRLFIFNELYRNKEGIRLMSLGDSICDITTGKLNANAMTENGQYPFFTCDANPYRIDTFAFDTDAIIISGNGSQVGHITHYKGKFNAYQRTYVLSNFRHADVNYLFHYFNTFLRDHILKSAKKGSVPYITLPMLSGFVVPVPPLEEQRRIVSILDKFDALVNDLTSGLPAEIAARRRQYEHYRDRLLSFN